MKSNNESPKQTSVLTAEEVKERISLLEKRNQEIDLEIELLQSQGFKVEELQWHIDKLHEYNEIKDAAQCVLGRLDNFRRAVRTKYSNDSERDLRLHLKLI
ncbi:DNA repair protein SWI5 homolog isoform X2 [Tachypleus tridentatus]|uniref:DNA repair protein SWI5 homolog isoform X2 n=1 Tax=Tachypleus tridentatus TaxID=6853 RepID=UPI003FD2625D